jgi:HD-like signal output (HDOD) protein
MNKKKILFVDDEPNILAGLRRMLRSMRNEFDMFFAESGDAALALCAEEQFDIVISDMRMPGMDGAQLLTLIQERHPQTIRIMLTGQADEDAIMRTVGVVHQFLAKPCDPEKLKSVLIKALALHNLLNNEKLKALILQLGTLPSIPTVYANLQRAIRDPEVAIDEVAGIIEKDIAMSAKVLHVVNSAFFGLYTRVDSPSRAVKLLGLDTVKALVLGVEIFTQTKLPKELFSAEDLWNHSMIVGAMAKKIAEQESDDQELIGNAFLAGILHDIGKLVLVSLLPDKYREAKKIAEAGEMTLHQAEYTIFNGAHGAVGAFLIGLWGFTSPVMEAIGFHHNISDYPSVNFSPAHAVHIANVLYYQNRPEEAVGAVLKMNLAELSKVTAPEKIDIWKKLCLECMGNVA